MNIIRLIVVIVLTLPLLLACGNFPAYINPIEPAKIDTGVVDYRHVNNDGNFTYHFFPEACFDAAPGNTCKHELTNGNRIQANDSVSINLLFGSICNFPEDARSWDELSRNYGDGEDVKPCIGEEARAGVKGEITVLATVFELDGKRKISFAQSSVADPEGRVVYYSEDVREAGQPLNLSNLPMYGPVSYHGKPVFLRFTLVEIDQKESKETGALLRSLASLGSKAYPPASPVLNALNKVGGAFLESQQDDLFFQYEMMFNGDGGTAPVVAPLSAGIMTFVRTQNRSDRFDWLAHCVDQTTGIIHTSGSPFCEGKCLPPSGKDNAVCRTNATEIRDHTYFTIQITKNEPALSNDAFQTFAELNEVTNEDVAVPNAITEYAEELGIEIEKTAVFDRARSLAKNLDSSSQVRQKKAQQAMIEALCLGFDGANGVFEKNQRLSPDKRYKLLDWLEQEWTGTAGSFDTTSYLDDSSAATMCTAPINMSNWSTLIN